MNKICRLLPLNPSSFTCNPYILTNAYISSCYTEQNKCICLAFSYNLVIDCFRMVDGNFMQNRESEFFSLTIRSINWCNVQKRRCPF